MDQFLASTSERHQISSLRTTEPQGTLQDGFPSIHLACHQYGRILRKRIAQSPREKPIPDFAETPGDRFHIPILASPFPTSRPLQKRIRLRVGRQDREDRPSGRNVFGDLAWEEQIVPWPCNQ